MSISMLGLEDIVGKRFESVELVVVEELKVEERNLFTIFPIGATIQDGGKRKEAMLTLVLVKIVKIRLDFILFYFYFYFLFLFSLF